MTAERRELYKPDGMSAAEEERITRIGNQLREEYRHCLMRIPAPMSDAMLELLCNAFGKGFGQGYMFAMSTDNQPLSGKEE